jgi:hypothetical protein
MVESEHGEMGKNTRALVKKLDAVGWGVFFIWIGIAFLADVGWGVGLLGVGVIALGTQVARKYLGLPIERFGVVIGIVFVLWGVWELLKIQLGETSIPGGLLPILFIVVGIVLVVSAFLRKPWP